MTDNDNQPATKKDVRDSQEELATIMAKSFDNVATKDDIKGLDQRMDRLEENTATKDDLKRVLEVVETIEENTRGLKDLPARVAQNEADIFKIKASSH